MKTSDIREMAREEITQLEAEIEALAAENGQTAGAERSA